MTSDVKWLCGWYVTRLHAAIEPSEGQYSTTAICGAVVYAKPRTQWAQKKFDGPVPHCKICEKKLKTL